MPNEVLVENSLAFIPVPLVLIIALLGMRAHTRTHTHIHTEVSSLPLNFVPNDTFMGYVGVKVLSPPLPFEDLLGKLGLLFTRGRPHSYPCVCVHMQAHTCTNVWFVYVTLSPSTTGQGLDINPVFKMAS